MANSVSLSYPEIWSKYMAKNYDAHSVMVPLVNRDIEADLAEAGDTVHVLKPGNVTINTYTPGTDISTSNFSVTDDTLALNQSKYFYEVIDKQEQSQSKLDLIKLVMDRGGVAMAQTIDTFLLAKSSDVDAGNIIGTSGSPITLTKDNVYQYFVQARLYLAEDNIPLEDLVAVVDPATESLILQSPSFVQSTPKGDSVVENATIGKFAGFRVVVSNRIASSGGVKDLMFFHRDFISLAIRINPNNVETGQAEKQFGTFVRAMGLYGAKVFNPKACVVLKKG